jgi:phosphoglycerate kinase
MLDSVDTILLCPAVVFTFLKSLKKEVGKSLVDDTSLDTAQNIIHKAQEKKVQLLFPIDYEIAYDTFNGPLSFVDVENFPHNGIGISIGPKTLEQWCTQIKEARTIFFNAAMGFSSRPKTQDILHQLIQCIASSSAHTVVGGGDSVSAVERFGFAEKISFLSTGGGATLTYLSGKLLPGLQNL